MILSKGLCRRGSYSQLVFMRAEAILKELETSKEYVSPAELAALYMGLDQKEQALASLYAAPTCSWGT